MSRKSIYPYNCQTCNCTLNNKLQAHRHFKNNEDHIKKPAVKILTDEEIKEIIKRRQDNCLLLKDNTLLKMEIRRLNEKVDKFQKQALDELRELRNRLDTLTNTKSLKRKRAASL
jgi:hypothetical protein